MHVAIMSSGRCTTQSYAHVDCLHVARLHNIARVCNCLTARPLILSSLDRSESATGYLHLKDHGAGTPLTHVVADRGHSLDTGDEQADVEEEDKPLLKRAHGHGVVHRAADAGALERRRRHVGLAYV